MGDPNYPEGVTEYDIDERSFAAFPGEATEEQDEEENETPEKYQPFDMQAYAKELIMGEARGE